MSGFIACKRGNLTKTCGTNVAGATGDDDDDDSAGLQAFVSATPVIACVAAGAVVASTVASKASSVDMGEGTRTFTLARSGAVACILDATDISRDPREIFLLDDFFLCAHSQRDQMKEEALLLGIGVLVSLLASASHLGRQIGAASRERTLTVTPRSGAFAIWGVIYTGLVVSVGYAALRPVSTAAAVAIFAAELMTAVWVPLFVHKHRFAPVASSAALLLAAGAACVAVFASGPLRGATTTLPRAVCTQVPFALFAGWLCCAAFLNVGIALKAYAGVEPPQWTLLLLAATVGGLALGARNAVLALPCLWALLWQRDVRSVSVLLGAVVCTGASVGAALLR